MTLCTRLRALPRRVRWIAFPLFFWWTFADLCRVTYLGTALQIAAWSAWIDVTHKKEAHTMNIPIDLTALFNERDRLYAIAQAVARRTWIDSYGHCQFNCGGEWGGMNGVTLHHDPIGYDDKPDGKFTHTNRCPAVEAYRLVLLHESKAAQ